MINTVVDILNDEVETLFALQDNRGISVDVCSAILLRTKRGILVNLTGAGECIGCSSEIFIFGTKGVIRTGAWGEKLEMVREGEGRFWNNFLKCVLGNWRIPVHQKLASGSPASWI